jgi:hypothetical protein
MSINNSKGDHQEASIILYPGISYNRTIKSVIFGRLLSEESVFATLRKGRSRIRSQMIREDIEVATVPAFFFFSSWLIVLMREVVGSWRCCG